MKSRLLLLLRFLSVLILAFVVMKVVFMLYNASAGEFSFADVLSVVSHGFPQDLSTVGYLSLLPWLVCLASVWVRGNWIKPVLRVYACIIGILLALILVGDCALYSFWKFKIDDTIFNYIFSPKDVVASVSGWYVVVGLLCVAALAAMIIAGLWLRKRYSLEACARRVVTSVLFVVVGGLLFLMIRGGVDHSTMNVGYVYYSSNQFLNHSAVNPAFSLFYSTLKHKDYSKLYQFYSEEECKRQFVELKYSTESLHTDTLLTTSRPNIVFILMEGLGATFVEAIGGKKDITPTLNRLYSEGVAFTQCYANAPRTDRGTICALSGYPSFPDLSVMRMTDKIRTMPSIARSLSEVGYTTSYLYGGDKNFGNANTYLLSTGYQRVDGVEHFPAAVHNTHSWGVTDELVLDTLYNMVMAQGATSGASSAKPPFFITCQTLASHEDWQVPYSRIADDPIGNSMAYLDNCIGKFLDRLKATPLWDNLLVIIVPDHGIQYPPATEDSDIRMCHIPLVFTGGAVRQPRRIDKICNQTDLAATLLGQLGITHDQFTFSRDVLSQTYTYPCAIHTFSHTVSFVDTTGVTVRDLNASTAITDSPRPSVARQRNAQTLLQRAIKDLVGR